VAQTLIESRKICDRAVQDRRIGAETGHRLHLEGAAVRRQLDSVTQNAVFLNIPYDQKFRSLYLAYIAGLVHLGFVPRVTLGLPGGARRLDKIFAEIQGCRYSIHDLSRVGLDRNPPSTPRFNMPFELGLSLKPSLIEFRNL
jgi:hypothetical protein